MCIRPSLVLKMRKLSWAQRRTWILATALVAGVTSIPQWPNIYPLDAPLSGWPTTSPSLANQWCSMNISGNLQCVYSMVQSQVAAQGCMHGFPTQGKLACCQPSMLFERYLVRHTICSNLYERKCHIFWYDEIGNIVMNLGYKSPNQCRNLWECQPSE